MSFKTDIIKFRIFGSHTCKECQKLSKAMTMHSIEYDFIDANDEKNDKLCDQFDIEELPCTQAIRSSDGKILLQKIGYFSPMSFLQDVSAEVEKLNKPTNMSLKGVRQSNPHMIRPTKKIESSCNGCKNE